MRLWIGAIADGGSRSSGPIRQQAHPGGRLDKVNAVVRIDLKTLGDFR